MMSLGKRDAKKDLPKSRWQRTKEAGKTSLKLGLKHVKHKAVSPFFPKDKRKEEKKLFDEESASILFNLLCTLKGTALKAAQILTLELNLLPLAYRMELSKACYKVPPMNKALIRKVLISEFGKVPEKVFKHFESEAFAAASIGQVHNAVIKGELAAAVKVQYPGIDETIKTDMGILKTLLLKVIPKSKLKYNYNFVKDILLEIEARLIEECDYKKEMKTGKFFYRNTNINGIVVPEVYEEFCTSRVLTVEKLEGLHLDEWLMQNPTQAEKDSAGQKIYDFFLHCLFDLNLLHADPNPGNFLFMKNGKLGVLDFGCVRKMDESFIEKMRNIVKCYLDEDYETVWKIYQSMDMLDKNWYEPKKLEDFGKYLVFQLREDSFDFKDNPGYVDEVINVSLKLDFFDSTFDEYVFLDRYFWGINRILEKLEAKVNMRKRWVSG